MVVVLFAASPQDGELTGLVLWVYDDYAACFEECHDRSVVLEHGERALFAGYGYRLSFTAIEAGFWCDDFDGHDW